MAQLVVVVICHSDIAYYVILFFSVYDKTSLRLIDQSIVQVLRGLSE